MTKTELKAAVTEAVEILYPEDDIVWSPYDEAMFEYYYAMFGKNVEVSANQFALVFDKGSYLTKVDLGSWTIVEVKDKKTGEIL